MMIRNTEQKNTAVASASGMVFNATKKASGAIMPMPARAA